MSELDRLNLIARQMENIRGGIRSLIYFRILAEETSTDMYFWLSTKITHLEHFILSFSKSFGSSSEDLHWKSTINNQGNFRKHLFRELSTDQHNFKKYLQSLLTIRNKVVAHTDLELSTVNIPSFDNALSAFKYLYKDLSSELLSFNEILVLDKGPACIEMWEINLNNEATEYIKAAVGATKRVREYY